MALQDAHPESNRRRGYLFEVDDWLADQIAGRFPSILEFQDGLHEGLRTFTTALFSSADHDVPRSLARSRIVGQATNDFLDLILEAMSGRGRPAARSSRALYEHIVNLRWVTNQPDQAQRYCDHAAIGDLLDLDLNTPTEDQYTGVTRKRVRHWRKKLERRIRPAAAAALDTYGESFRRSWTPTNLRDRARTVGLDTDYDLYRLLSSVIHGSAAGDLGQRQEIDGRQVVRTGPAVALCPLALRTGLGWYRMIVGEVEASLGSGATDGLAPALDQLAADLPTHEALCHLVDAELWPDEPPQSIVFLRVEVGGQWRWLLLDADLPRTIEVEPIGLGDDQRKWLESEVAAVEEANPDRTQPLIIAVAGVSGSPRPGAAWEPASENLRQRAPWEERETFRALHVREPVWDPSLHG